MSKLVEELVHQFADPLAFYRELIQNSLDAGSKRIEIMLRYMPGSPGVVTATVSDWGEGMTRQTIERFLLTKFRSSKEGDLTKIGKFGVGFMSVLAPGPQLVVVDTGRDGEDWRLLLAPDFSYELRRAPEPLEGTRVTLHKEMSPPEYRDFAEGSRQSVRRWCRHADADILFGAGGDDGSPPPAALEPVREPFVVDAPYVVEHREEGTFIVAGIARDAPPACGFYNRGLTLLETGEEMVPGVTFKIQSRYLEHTLTRDNVRRDRHFSRAMKLVRALAEGPLLERLPGELRAAAERADEPAMRVLLCHAEERLGRGQLWFPLAAGGAVDGDRLRKSARREGALLFAEPGCRLATALAAQEVAVLRRAGPDVERLALEVTERHSAHAGDHYALAVDPDESEAARALGREFLRLVRAAGAAITGCVVAELAGAGVARTLTRIDALGAVRRLPPEEIIWSRGAPLACLNRAHPRVRAALALAETSPALAALLLARECAAAAGKLDGERDRALTEAALA